MTSGSPTRKTLDTDSERVEYHKAFVICNPTIEPRAPFVSLLAGVYGGGIRDPDAIATGLAQALASITKRSAQSAHSKEIWHQACLDALLHSGAD
jgi:hypothetical protein